MSKTSWALLVKFALTFAAAGIAFALLDQNTLGWAFAIAALGTVLNYVIGDLGILPRAGNAVASIMDGILAAGTAFLVDLFSRRFDTTVRSLLVFGAIVGISEAVFHRYLVRSKKVAP